MVERANAWRGPGGQVLNDCLAPVRRAFEQRLAPAIEQRCAVRTLLRLAEVDEHLLEIDEQRIAPRAALQEREHGALWVVEDGCVAQVVAYGAEVARLGDDAP